jgi:hypothetical protein
MVVQVILLQEIQQSNLQEIRTYHQKVHHMVVENRLMKIRFFYLIFLFIFENHGNIIVHKGNCKNPIHQHIICDSLKYNECSPPQRGGVSP